MARMIRLVETGPYRIDPQDKPLFICGCGLSQNLPHCDGSHSKCRNEPAGELQVYNTDRTEVVETQPDRR